MGSALSAPRTPSRRRHVSVPQASVSSSQATATPDGGPYHPSYTSEFMLSELLHDLPLHFAPVVGTVSAIINGDRDGPAAKTLKTVALIIYQRILTLDEPLISRYANFCRVLIQSTINPLITDGSTRDSNGRLVYGGHLFREVLLAHLTKGLATFLRRPYDNTEPPEQAILFLCALCIHEVVSLESAHSYLRDLREACEDQGTQEIALRGMCALLETLGWKLESHRDSATRHVVEKCYHLLREALLKEWVTQDVADRITVRRFSFQASAQVLSNVQGILGERCRRHTLSSNMLPPTIPSKRSRKGRSRHKSLPSQTSTSSSASAVANFRPSGTDDTSLARSVERDMARFKDHSDIASAVLYFTQLASGWHIVLVEDLITSVFSRSCTLPFATGVFSHCASDGIVSPRSFKTAFLEMIRNLDAIASEEPEAYLVMAALIQAACLSKSAIEELATAIRPMKVPSPREKLLNALSELSY